jgi:hypothetical protein
MPLFLRTNMKFISQTFLVGVALLSLTGCSSFNRQWREAAQTSSIAQGLIGAWEGRWISDVNGHKGDLRCIITQTAADKYDAHFRAKYKKILSFEYTVPLTVTQDGESFRFEGSADLGKLAGGVYTYKGAASAGTFFSTYDSKYDHGKFDMKRASATK